jgi:hypothetical protein
MTTPHRGRHAAPIPVSAPSRTRHAVTGAHRKEVAPAALALSPLLARVVPAGALVLTTAAGAGVVASRPASDAPAGPSVARPATEPAPAPTAPTRSLPTVSRAFVRDPAARRPGTTPAAASSVSDTVDPKPAAPARKPKAAPAPAPAPRLKPVRQSAAPSPAPGESTEPRTTVEQPQPAPSQELAPELAPTLLTGVTGVVDGAGGLLKPPS